MNGLKDDSEVDNLSSFRSDRNAEQLKQHEKDIHNVGVNKVDKWMCDCCGKRYATNFTLKRHRRSKHKSIPELISSKPFTCYKCSAKFTAKKGLIKHLSVIHSLETPRKRSLNSHDLNFPCYLCEKKFSSTPSVKRHLAKVHKITKTNYSGHFICPICKTHWNSSKALDGHLLEKHEVFQEEEELQFASWEDFHSWKKKVEKLTKARYSQSSGKRQLLGGQRIYYNCFRSGVALNKGNGIRTTQKESIKINATCPSRMVVTLIKDKPIEVQFSKVHVGHSSESCFVPTILSDDEDESHVLQDEEDADCKSDISAPSSKDAAQTIHVIEEYESENNDTTDDEVVGLTDECDAFKSVIYHKVKNTECDGLNSEEFLIVMMTKDQEEVLLNYKDGRVVVDISQEATNYQVTALLTLDKRSTVCPMAFCISNRRDEVAMRLFFEVVKMRVGVIETNIFMFDGRPGLYTAWERTMSPSKHLLLSSWHVDTDWREKCLEMTSNAVKAVEMYRGCRVLLETTELDELAILLETFLSTCANDPDMREFGEYFRQKYGSCPEKWSSAHRVRLGLYTNTYLESLFKKLRYCYPEGKKYRTVEEIISALTNLSQDVIFERMMCRIKKKSEKDIMTERHEISKEISASKIDVLSQCEWEVHCCILKEPYKVVFDTDGQCKDCNLFCYECDACIHQVTCTCNDYLLDSVFCEHTHACLSLRQSQPLSETDFSLVSPNQLQNAIKRLEELAKQVPSKCIQEVWTSTEKLSELMQKIVDSSQ